MTKLFLDVVRGGQSDRPPFWYMRQAGRYLPEYRAERQQAGGFLDMVYNPDRAAEVTLQPIRRFHMDAAILFSDILVIPHALGQELWFEEGHGPRLEPVEQASDLARLKPEAIHDTLAPIYETVRQVVAGLPDDVTMIGFAGSPWTIATYMVEGKTSRDQARARLWAYQDPQGFAALIDLIIEATIAYLNRQIDAGAEVVQLFDSWAGALAPDLFEKHVISATKKIISGVKSQHPETPIIGFPRLGATMLVRYFEETGVDALGLDTGIDPAWAAAHLQPIGPVQGNLDPHAVIAGGAAMKAGAQRIADALRSGPHLFNLGHGLTPETPVEHVAALSQWIKQGAR